MAGLERGTRIAGRYVLEETLAGGGMGVIVRARDERLGRFVAVKLLLAADIGDAAARARLLLEARSAAALEHPGVIHVYDVGETDDGGAFIAMELVRGQSFRARLEQGITIEESLRVVVDVARALAFAHRAGLVHRDVKPDNIMIREDGRAVLLDFGIAKQVLAVPTNEARPSEPNAPPIGMALTLTTTGALVGTPAYLAPEQARGEAVDGRADQFALGIVAFEAMTGQRPWRETTPVGILTEVFSDAPIEVSLGEELEVLEPILRRALSRKAEDRYPDLDAFADALASAAMLPVSMPRITSPGESASRISSRLSRPVQTELSMASATTRAAVKTPVVASAPPPETWPSAPVAKSAPAPPEAPAIAPRRVSRRVRALLAIGAAIAIGAGGLYSWRDHARQRQTDGPLAIPLAAPASILACPQLRASGVAEPSGWLGAAAASLVCLRARALLGGASERALVPAELLDLPAQPVDGFPEDPYGAPDARERSLSAAKTRASAWIDGEIAKDRDAFRVELVMRASDGREIGRGSGDGALHVAVEHAMAVLVASGALPIARALDPRAAPWMQTTSAEVATAMADWEVATSNYDVLDAVDACHDIAARRADIRPAEFIYLANGCSHDPDTGMPQALEPGPIDRSTSPAFFSSIRAYLSNTSRAADSAKLSDELHERLRGEPSALGRSELALLESELRQSLGDMTRARELALASVQADPKTGNDTWFQLLATSLGTPGHSSVSRAYAAWAPWAPTAWVLVAPAVGDVDTRLEWARRGFAIAPHGFVAKSFAKLLIEKSAREEARGVAVSLERGLPQDKLIGELLLIRIDASEARFKAALDRARRALDGIPTEPVALTRHAELVVLAGSLSQVLGRPTDFADDLVARFIDPDPPRVDPWSGLGPTELIGLCMLANRHTAPRCLSKLRALFVSGFFQNSTFPSTPALIDGAERYVAGDLRGATRAWRPLLQTSEQFVAMMSGPMADAFERTGEDDLAERIDAQVVAGDGELGGASLATVRAAKRAAKRGDRKRAKELAEKVVSAWSLADDVVPSVEEMRKLIASLR